MPKPKAITTPLEEPQTPEQAKPHWPEAKEKRTLRCDLKPIDINELGKANAVLGSEIDRLEDSKKASQSQYKANIEEREARRRANETAIRNGWVERDVGCHWEFECAGIDSATGEKVFHPEKKTLFRDDDGTVVEIRDISEGERQMALPLDQAEEDPTNHED